MTRKNRIMRLFWKNIGGQDYWTVEETDRPVTFEDFSCSQPMDHWLQRTHRKDCDTAIKAKA